MPEADRIRSLFEDIGFDTILIVLAVVLVTMLFITAVQKVLPKVAELLPSRLRLVVLNAVPIIRLSLVALAVVVIVPLVFNVTLRNFVFVLGTLGVALGFALKDYVSSAVAGIVAVFERPYRTGDWVRLKGHYGEVMSIGTRSVTLRTAADDIITVPHAVIWSDSVVNANDAAATLQCVAEFWLAPGQPGPDVRPILEEVARTSAWLDYDRPVRVVTKSEPYGVHVTLRAYPFELRDQFQFITDLTERGRAALLAAGAPLIVVPAVAP